MLFRFWQNTLSVYSRVFLVLFVATVFAAVLPGCGEEKETAKTASQQPADKYADWTWYSYGRVKIFHPPGHLQLDNFKEYCERYESSIDQISELLAMEPPQDTLVIYYYTGFGQGREFTGRMYPFVDKDTIYFWLPSFSGPTLVDWLLPKWVPEPSKYRFLSEGLRALFDFSGQNYHHGTYNNLKDHSFVRLRDLPNDPNMDSNTERVQTSEAASFCAFIIAQYGALRLKTIYQYQKPFDQMVPEVFQKPLDSLEQDWLAFAWHNLPDSVRTSEFRQMALPGNIEAHSVARAQTDSAETR